MKNKLSENELLQLARKAVPGLETLQARNSDRLDFHEAGVWGLREAIEAAFELGLSRGQKGNQR